MKVTFSEDEIRAFVIVGIRASLFKGEEVPIEVVLPGSNRKDYSEVEMPLVIPGMPVAVSYTKPAVDVVAPTKPETAKAEPVMDKPAAQVKANAKAEVKPEVKVDAKPAATPPNGDTATFSDEEVSETAQLFGAEKGDGNKPDLDSGKAGTVTAAPEASAGLFAKPPVAEVKEEEKAAEPAAVATGTKPLF